MKQWESVIDMATNARRDTPRLGDLGPVPGRGEPGELAEAPAERAQAGETHRQAHVGDRQLAGAQQRLGPLDPPGEQVLVGRLAVCLPVAPREVRGRHRRGPGHRRHVERPRVLAVDQVARAAQVDELAGIHVR
jgi:hypothetical protein